MKRSIKPFALCVDDTDYKASLIPGKVYRIISDVRAAKDDLVRIVDESGEDYLYHKCHFLFVGFFGWKRLRIHHERMRQIANKIIDLQGFYN